MRSPLKIALSLALLVSLSSLAACDGSGGDGAPMSTVPSDTAVPAVDEPAPPVAQESLSRRRLDGRVVEAIDSVPLAGVTVTLRAPGGGPLATTETDADGRYAFAAADAGAAEILFSLAGYREERLGAEPAAPVGAATLETVRLVSDDNAGVGSASGLVVGVDGQPAAGVTVAFVRGIGRVDEAAALTTTTAEDGSWSFADLDYGNWICIVYGPDIAPSYVTITVLGGVDLAGLDSTALPELADDEIAIVTARDAGARWPNVGLNAVVTLSDPDTALEVRGVPEGSSRIPTEGPHVVVVRLPDEGTLTYSLRKRFLAGYAAMSETGVRVRVIDARGVRAAFTPPEDRRGDAWQVFELSLADGTVRAIDELF